MTENESFEHGEVVSGLLDLQRRLRGGDPASGEASADAPSSAGPVRTVEEPRTQERPPETAPDSVTVSESDVSVLMAPSEPAAAPPAPERFAPVTQLPTAVAGDDRMSALAERLSRLERDLSGVLGSIESIKGDVAVSLTADVDARMIAVQQEVEARAARTVAERMDAISSRVSGELDAQRRDLAEALDRRIGSMEVVLRETIRDAAASAADADDPQE